MMDRRAETMVVTQPTPTVLPSQHGQSANLNAVWGLLVSTVDGSTTRLVGRTTIGRMAPATIIVDDSRISGQHFDIYCDQETTRCSPKDDRYYDSYCSSDGSPTMRPYGTSYWVRDLSTNGTFVNHRRVGRGRTCRIQTGDDISIVLLPPAPALSAAGNGSNNTASGNTVAAADTSLRPSAVKRGRDSDGHHQGNKGNERHYLITYVFHAFAPHASDAASPPMVPNWPHATPPIFTDDSQYAAPRSSMHVINNNAVDDELPISWQWGRLIGQGAQAQVYQAINTTTGQMMAVKVLKDLTAEATAEGTVKLVVNNNTAAEAEDPGDPLKVDADWHLHNPETPTMPSLPNSNASSPGVFLLDRSSSVLHRRSSTAACKKWGVTSEQRAELRLLRSLKHRRIVQYLGFAVQDGLVCILLEFVAGGSLQTLINNFGWFAESVVRIYALQMLQGLEYLHQSHVVHGDIKPANILVSDRGEIKLSDFGTGKILRRGDNGRLFPLDDSQSRSPSMAPVDLRRAESENTTGGRTLMGTPHWMSPELSRTGEASFSSDIWAFGCVVLEMATGRLPWSEKPLWNHPATAIYNIANATSGPSLQYLRDEEREISNELIDFLSQTFVIDAFRRPSASQLLQHPFLTRSSHTRIAAPTAAGGTGGAPVGPSEAGSLLLNMASCASAPSTTTSTRKFADHLSYLRTHAGDAVGGAAPNASSGLTAFMQDL